MKRILIALLALSSLLVTAAPAAAASQRAAALKRELGSGAKVATSRETGLVRFVGTRAGRPIPRPAGVSRSAAPRTAARAFFAQHGKAFGITNAARDLRVMSTHAASGRSTVRFQQLRSDIPVVGGELLVNLDHDANVLSASGESGAAPESTTPRVTSAAARQGAIAVIAKRERVNAVRLQATDPSLWVYDARLLGGPGPQTTRLVWRLEVTGGAGLSVDQLVLIDAETGAAVLNIDQIEEIKNRSVCDANNTQTQVPCTSPVRTEGSTPAAGEDADVAPAYNFAGDTYDFYATGLNGVGDFGRDSLDDNGLPLKSTIDFCNPTCPFKNAFWSSAQKQMVYGDGFASADDVVGHELTHGVTDFSAHLFYYYQSGAINESLSDIMGEFIDQTNGVGTDTPEVKWLVGEDLPTIGAIRDMKDPTHALAGQPAQPDRMSSPNYTQDPDEGDSGGVHTNSGVSNKAAYLMSDGAVFNSRTVTGIGPAKVARIYYTVQTEMLTSGSDYADLASALPQACSNLVGTIGITAANCTQVSNAVAAVEMAAQPTNSDNGTTDATAPEAPQITCATGETVTPLFSDDMEGFETDADDNWDTETVFPPAGGDAWTADTDYAHSGFWNLSGLDPQVRADTDVFMTHGVAIPATAKSAYLRFDHAYGFDDDADGGYDGGVVEVSTNGGASWTDVGALFTANGYDGKVASFFGNASLDSPLVGKQAFIRESNGYISSLATLTSLRGKSLRFRFRIGSDSTAGDFGWFLDDVAIAACTSPPPSGGSTPPGGGTTPPPGGGTTPAVTLKSAKLRSCKISGKGKKLRVKCTLSKSGAVRRATITIKKGKKTVLKKSLKPTSKGVLSIKPKRKLAKGSYKVSIVIRDAAGKKRTLKKTLKVR
jgi:bacillolysin